MSTAFDLAVGDPCVFDRCAGHVTAARALGWRPGIYIACDGCGEVLLVTCERCGNLAFKGASGYACKCGHEVDAAC